MHKLIFHFLDKTVLAKEYKIPKYIKETQYNLYKEINVVERIGSKSTNLKGKLAKRKKILVSKFVAIIFQCNIIKLQINFFNSYSTYVQSQL